MAIIDAAYCYDAQKQYAESERLLRLLLDQPDVVWTRAGEWWAWAPNCGSAHQFWAASTSSLVRPWLARIDKLRLKNDQRP